MTDILCVSERRWDAAADPRCQLPGYVKNNYRLLFVEPPCLSRLGTSPRLEVFPVHVKQCSDVHVVRMVFPKKRRCNVDYSDPSIQQNYQRLLMKLMHRHSYTDPIIWLSTSSGMGLANDIPHRLIIWDRRHDPSSGERTSVEFMKGDLIVLSSYDDTVHRA